MFSILLHKNWVNPGGTIFTGSKLPLSQRVTLGVNPYEFKVQALIFELAPIGYTEYHLPPGFIPPVQYPNKENPSKFHADSWVETSGRYFSAVDCSVQKAFS